MQDNNLDTWTAWGNEYWPADYLIDATGQVRYATFGEGDYTTTEAAIRVLLAEAGAKGLGVGAKAHDVIVPSFADDARDLPRRPRARPAGSAASRSAGTHTYAKPGFALTLNDFSYGGTWTIGPQQALAGAGATIDAQIKAKNVYIVLTPPAHGAGRSRCRSTAIRRRRSP